MAALATVADLEVIAGPQTDTVRAGRLLEMASTVAERWCGRRFARVVNDVRAVDVFGGILRLPDGPVVSVASVTGPAPSVTAYAATSYQVRPDGALPRSYGPGWWAPGTYTVTYTHGYDPIPDDVIVAVCRMVERVIAGPDGGLRSESIGEASFEYAAAWTTGMTVGVAEQALLSPYRRLGTPIPMAVGLR